ncbi:hypothetical protein TA3x_004943 [Tundrisphaera sp. TA3]|uniref:hypothetical protein n=1 Tax=Tundrisphaera sp. TA3 TaxID=3435775 RepID=UPI003EB723B1
MMAIVELPEAYQTVIQALLAAPLAWQTPAELASALDADVEETTDHLATLDAEGWLVAWEGGDGAGPAVTLSTAAAARLGARLVEHGADELPRWATRGEADPPPHRALGVFRCERAASLEMVIDPRERPDVALESAEAAAESLAAPQAETLRPGSWAGRMPRPTLLLGTGASPWPGPGRDRDAGQACPICGDRPLKPTMYCLACDRWGLDHRIVAEVAEARPATIPELREPAGGSARREAEARARKDKRRARFALIEEARRAKKGGRSRSSRA